MLQGKVWKIGPEWYHWIMKTSCPNCQNKTKFWRLQDRRLKCRDCGKKFSLRKRIVHLEKRLLRQIISEFVLEHSTNIILARVEISKYKLLKLLTLLRIEMTMDLPEAFDGTVEVDETYLGAQMRNRRAKEKRKYAGKSKSTSGFGTIKQPVFGILCRSGKVWARIIDRAEAADLQPLIEKQVKRGSTVCSDTWRGYTGIASKGYVHRMVNHREKQYSDRKGSHINGLEGFWGYLKRKLAAKGGIRKSRLHLYLGEYVWRYNHRSLSLKEQEKLLYKLIIKYF